MAPFLNAHADELSKLCVRFGVARLDVFGSAAAGRFDPRTSDLDFLVSFSPAADMTVADQYFGLLAALENLFGRRIDLVMERALRNPYFIEAVNRSRQVVYAA